MSQLFSFFKVKIYQYFYSFQNVIAFNTNKILKSREILENAPFR